MERRREEGGGREEREEERKEGGEPTPLAALQCPTWCLPQGAYRKG